MARTSLRVVVAALSFVFLAGSASSALAQAYKYKDDRGNIHFTEHLHEIPARYRSQVEVREMPVQAPAPGSPEAAAAQESSIAASFQQVIQEERGQSLTPEQQTALQAWMSRWWIPALLTIGLNFAVSLGLVIHAFNTGHVGWGLANFFLGFTTPIYLFVHVEQSLAMRFGLFAIMLSPLVVIGMAVAQLATALA